MMRQKCEECGDYKTCDDNGICYDCLQDKSDMEDWLIKDEEETDHKEDELEEDGVK